MGEKSVYEVIWVTTGCMAIPVLQATACQSRGRFKATLVKYKYTVTEVDDIGIGICHIGRNSFFSVRNKQYRNNQSE